MFVADLHIHSRFSMATSKQLTLPHLAGWAMCKGIHVLGTGDFTHPAWRRELREGLEFDEESGFYRLKGKPDRVLVDGEIPDARAPLFCLQTEISSIYRRGGKARRVHNCVYFQTLDEVDRFSKRLAAIGNIESDGRPILGLDSRDLLEIVLETSDKGVLVPAHIWTPWFSLFGSKSGFDTIEDCFGDLTEHIFALETGLSSDPAMNRLVSALDGYVLISNSDAHSGANLGREGNLFGGTPSYDGMFEALRTAAERTGRKDPSCWFDGTLEIYPEEGKYHMDGHRACNVRMTPRESLEHGNVCPVCGKPLTIGVLHRVWELADRDEEVHLPNAPAVHPVIPLPTIIAECHGVKPTSRKAQNLFRETLERLGGEFSILANLEIDAIRGYDPALGEAVDRIRTGRVHLEGGYDGEFGTVSVFGPGELEALGLAEAPGRLTARRRGRPPRDKKTGEAAQTGSVVREGSLLAAAGVLPDPESVLTSEKDDACGNPDSEGGNGGRTPRSDVFPESGRGVPDRRPDPLFRAAVAVPLVPDGEEHDEVKDGLQLWKKGTSAKTGGGGGRKGFILTEEQEAACAHRGGPMLVLAGPGSGKTRLLTERVARLLEEGVDKGDILALTFSRKAGGEIAERVRTRVEDGDVPFCGTFHSYAWRIVREQVEEAVLLTETRARRLLAQAAEQALPMLSEEETKEVVRTLELAREHCTRLSPSSPAGRLLDAYRELKNEGNVRRFDFADVLEWLADNADDMHLVPYSHVLVDEVQDLSFLQLRVLRVLTEKDGSGLFAIGDPDQSIYGFRGAVSDVLGTLRSFWPDLVLVRLGRSFRSGQDILDAASRGLGGATVGPLVAARRVKTKLVSFEAPDQAREERWVADRVADMLGATSHTLLDGSGVDWPKDLVPSDVAVLVRLRAQIPSLARALAHRGVPVQTPALDCFWQDEKVSEVLAFLEEALRSGAGDRLGLAAGMGVHTTPPAQLLPWLAQEGRADAELSSSPAWEAMSKAFAKAGTWEDFFEDLAFRREADQLREKAQSVRLMTMHAAKGLEFRVVFLPGFNEGVLPLDRELLAGRGKSAALDPAALAEERHLLYVAITRASEVVCVSMARRRKIYGRELELVPSRFFAPMERLFGGSRLVRHEARRLVPGSLFPRMENGKKE